MKPLKRPKRFDPTKLGLDENFSLLNYSALKGWGCKVPQNVLYRYLKDIGDGSIGKETPDCSVVPVYGDPTRVIISTTDFFYPVTNCLFMLLIYLFILVNRRPLFTRPNCLL